MEVSMRKPYFIDEEEEEEVSSSLCHKTRNNHYHPHTYYYNHQYSPRSVVMSAKFNDFRFERQPVPHFLDSCFLCKKPLGENRDIFMYRGDTPFCSEECRGEQIERDEEKEKKQSLSSSVKAMRRNEKRSSSSSPTRTRPYNVFHTGTLAAA